MTTEERWREEAAFFDSKYGKTLLEPINQVTIRRYTRLERRWLAREYLFSLLGDVQGKEILDLGCGVAGEAIVLALRGARVWGVDISERAIEIANARASMHGVQDRVHLACGPIERYVEQCRQKFDVVLSVEVLHHLIFALESVMKNLAKLSHPGTEFVCSEPINLHHWYRTLRLRIPLPVNATSSERPLEGGELKIVKMYCPDLRIRYFDFLLRGLNRLSGGYYETRPILFRRVYDLVAYVDNLLLENTRLQELAATAVLYGHLRADG